MLVNADQKLLKGKNITANMTKGFKVCLENDVKYKILGFKFKHRYWLYKEAYVSVDSSGGMIGEKKIKLHHTSKIT